MKKFSYVFGARSLQFIFSEENKQSFMEFLSKYEMKLKCHRKNTVSEFEYIHVFFQEFGWILNTFSNVECWIGSKFLELEALWSIYPFLEIWILWNNWINQTGFRMKIVFVPHEIGHPYVQIRLVQFKSILNTYI